VVYKKLETAILSGHIHPGDRIITEEVAQRLGVSKIPVREALRGLEAGGLISTKPNCGSTVTELSKENLAFVRADITNVSLDLLNLIGY